VGVDEAREQRPAAKVDAPGTRTYEVIDVAIVADRDDPPGAHRDGSHGWLGLIHRHDGPADEGEVGRPCRIGHLASVHRRPPGEGLA
jgi:hypothetical protein